MVLLDTTDPTNINGCTVTPPYLDEYGEADPGLRCVGVCVKCGCEGVWGVCVCVRGVPVPGSPCIAVMIIIISTQNNY